MEYLMTYGWAILIIIVVGISMWQMGLFSPGAAIATSFSGFSTLRPIEQYCVAGPGGSDTLTVVLANTAGRSVQNITMSVSGAEEQPCETNLVLTGKKGRCLQTNINCGADKPGERYEVDISIGFDSLGGRRASAGTIWGPAE